MSRRAIIRPTFSGNCSKMTDWAKGVFGALAGSPGQLLTKRDFLGLFLTNYDPAASGARIPVLPVSANDKWTAVRFLSPIKLDELGR